MVAISDALPCVHCGGGANYNTSYQLYCGKCRAVGPNLRNLVKSSLFSKIGEKAERAGAILLWNSRNPVLWEALIGKVNTDGYLKDVANGNIAFESGKAPSKSQWKECLKPTDGFTVGVEYKVVTAGEEEHVMIDDEERYRTVSVENFS